jgi:hypothetical protein
MLTAYFQRCGRRADSEAQPMRPAQGEQVIVQPSKGSPVGWKVNDFPFWHMNLSLC